MWLRYVLVPGLTDDLEDIGQIAGFAAGLGNVERVDVLPFHQMGKFKWEQLGIPYTLARHGAARQRAGRAGVRRVSRGRAEGVLSQAAVATAR